MNSRSRRTTALLALLATCLGLAMAGCTQPGQAATRDPDPAAPAPGTLTAPTPLPATPALTPIPSSVPLDDASPPPSRPGPVTVPILLYHHVRASAPLVRYSLDAQRFEAQLDDLVNHGYHTITMQDLVDAIRTGAPLPDRPIVLTFDDGNLDVLEQAFPRMLARGMVGVVYVVGNRIGAEGFLSGEDLKRLRDAGWEIGSHGMTHLALSDLRAEAMPAEIEGSKTAIEAALGKPIHSFAYPFGMVTDESLLLVVAAGYTSGAGLGIGNEHRPDGLLYLSRREVRGTYDLESFRALLGPPG